MEQQTIPIRASKTSSWRIGHFNLGRGWRAWARNALRPDVVVAFPASVRRALGPFVGPSDRMFYKGFHHMTPDLRAYGLDTIHTAL